MSQFDQVHSTKKYRLLTRKRDVAGNEYVYLKGVASTAVGSAVTFDEAGATQLVDTDVASSVIAPMAVAQAAVDATTEFGWYMIYGSCSCSAATVADNAKVFATATAAQLDDTGTAGQQVVGAVWRSADSGGLATIQLSYPMLGINVA